MQFIKTIAVFALAVAANAYPWVDNSPTVQQRTNTGTNTGTNATPCGQNQGYLACCTTQQGSSQPTTQSFASLASSILPYLSAYNQLIYSVLGVAGLNIPVDIQTAVNCVPILSGQTTICTQTQQCCFSGPTSQSTGSNFIGLFNNNNVIFCPNFVTSVPVPITG